MRKNDDLTLAVCGLDCKTCPIRRLPFDEKAAAKVIGWYQSEGWLKKDEGKQAFARLQEK